MRAAPVIGIVLITFVAAACGDPGGANEFTFDPIPLVTTGSGTPVAVDGKGKCHIFAADQIEVIVEIGHADEFLKAAGKAGFKPLEERPAPAAGVTTITLDVPLASVPDALEYAMRQPGVKVAATVDLGPTGFPENLPTPIVPCSNGQVE